MDSLYFVKTLFMPEFELRDARVIAEELKVRDCCWNTIFYLIPRCRPILLTAVITVRPAIFRHLKQRALSDGFSLFLDGTNASDDWGDRPGMKALKELEIRSPLRECGLIKEEIRRLSKEAGLFTWNKPSYACLATRFPTGTGLTEENLQKVEKAESALAEMGFSDYRVRVCQGAARLQFPEKPMASRRREPRKNL